MCTLIVTHQCNLNCIYCYESYKSDQSMPIEVARKVIESEFEFVSRSNQFNELAIDFTGGEPLVQFELIKEIAEWIWAAPRPVPYILFSTTNGTLLDARMKKWFCRHKQQYYLSLSLDGTPGMHTANRGHGLEEIDLDYFRKNWPDQPVKMTVSCDTMDSLSEGIVYLQERGFKIGASLGYGMPWSNKSVLEYRRQLRKLAEYYLEHDQMSPVSLLDLPVQHILRSQTDLQKKYCGTGTHMATYDVDGKAYPCHLFTPLVLGASESLNLSAIQFYEDLTVTDRRCNGCLLGDICPTCYGFNYKQTGDVARRDQMMCRLFKVQALENSWYQAQRLKRKRRDGALSLDDIRKAKACLLIMEQITIEPTGDILK
ncbi:MAG: 4Fe-4S cluster-binding domain-containing protein [Kiritimatiellales bacterium]|nr:4Fe-4S cluster-binding domain-containing protein [Kiritimatiellales bacterium]